MAFLQDDEEKKEGQESQPQTAGQSASITGQPGAAPGGAPRAVGAASAPKGSGSFVNLQKYVDANKPKTQQMVSGITQGVRGSAQELKSDLEKQKEQTLGAESALAKEEERLDTGGYNFYKDALSRAGTGKLTQEDIDRFQKIRNQEGAELSGPDLQEQQARAKDLERRAKQFGTTQGRLEELDKTVGQQSSTYGGKQRSLDALLIAGDRGNRVKAIRDINKATSGLTGDITNLETMAKNRIGQLAGKRKALADAAGADWDKTIGGLTTDVEKRRQMEEARRQAAREKLAAGDIVGALQGVEGDLASKWIGKFRDPNADLRTYGVINPEELGGLISEAEASVGKGDVMSPEEIARYTALQKLGGQTPEEIRASGVKDPYARLRDVLSQIDQRKSDYESKLASSRGEVRNVRDRLLEDVYANKMKGMENQFTQRGFADMDAKKFMDIVNDPEQYAQLMGAKENLFDPQRVEAQRKGTLDWIKAQEQVRANEYNQELKDLESRLAADMGFDPNQRFVRTDPSTIQLGGRAVTSGKYRN